MKPITEILVIHSPNEMLEYRKTLSNNTIGFVPTMGALHQGHAQLIKKSNLENDITIVSIFINPTQFNDKNDFLKYPKTWDQDLTMAKECGAQLIFAPNYSEMYPDDYKYKIIETDFSKQLCGAHREGHFDGVLSVVMKLFNLVHPQKAYFGEKDFQQMTLLQGMVKAFFMPLQIVPVPTLRESDGLAMSSRNVRLSLEQRKIAPLLYKILQTANTPEEATLQLTKAGFKVDYVEDWNNRRIAAAFLGDVRLIDNINLSVI